MERIPQSVALRVTFEAYLTGTDTPATGKTIAIQISKNGAGYANLAAGAVNATEIATGSYYVDLAVADVGTLGPAIVKGTEGTIGNVKVHLRVVDPNTLGAAALPAVAAGAAGSVARTVTGATIPEAPAVYPADMVKINGTAVTGDGTATPWGPV